MKKPKGEAAFNQYFSYVYGERWPEVYKALHLEDKKVARVNAFYNEGSVEVAGVKQATNEFSNAFEITGDFDLSALGTALLPYYRMDPASMAAALALDVSPGHKVLDMCAAPGGKSLILLEQLTGIADGNDIDTSGSFVANELSPKRRHRMMSVFKRHLPLEVRQMTQIIGRDGSRIGLSQKDLYDRILLDAPCSGERGVVAKASEFEKWSQKRTKSFGVRQYALLSSAFMALKPGGKIVYSTCSISPYENDLVVAKLLKRKPNEVTVLSPPKYEKAEATQYGQQFLPDRSGWGPIYFALIQKTSR